MSSHGHIHVPDDELHWQFSRSSGPGGQHVNTSDTRVELRWDLAASRALTEAQKDLARGHLATRMVGNEVRIVSSQYRSQHRNREAARTRLEHAITAALVPPKKRRPTRPSRAAEQRRRSAKAHRSSIKAQRRERFD
jgi:ribosome-associated protein